MSMQGLGSVCIIYRHPLQNLSPGKLLGPIFLILPSLRNCFSLSLKHLHLIPSGLYSKHRQCGSAFYECFMIKPSKNVPGRLKRNKQDLKSNKSATQCCSRLFYRQLLYGNQRFNFPNRFVLGKINIPEVIFRFDLVKITSGISIFPNTNLFRKLNL